MNKCDMIKDLLPLYADDVCSEESRKAVKEHINSCPDCKAELEKLRKNVTVSPQKDADVLKRIKKRLRTEKIVVGIIIFLAICGVLFFGLIYLINSDKSMDMKKYRIISMRTAEKAMPNPLPRLNIPLETGMAKIMNSPRQAAKEISFAVIYASLLLAAASFMILSRFSLVVTSLPRCVGT